MKILFWIILRTNLEHFIHGFSENHLKHFFLFLCKSKIFSDRGKTFTKKKRTRSEGYQLIEITKCMLFFLTQTQNESKPASHQSLVNVAHLRFVKVRTKNKTTQKIWFQKRKLVDQLLMSTQPDLQPISLFPAQQVPYDNLRSK